MQPYREPFTIELPNKVRLRFDPNGIEGTYAMSIFTRQGARISGFFPLADLGRLADAINAEICRAEIAANTDEAAEEVSRILERDLATVLEEPDTEQGIAPCRGAGIVYQCLHGEPMGGCKCMGAHEVVVFPCPETCTAGRG